MGASSLICACESGSETLQWRTSPRRSQYTHLRCSRSITSKSHTLSRICICTLALRLKFPMSYRQQQQNRCNPNRCLVLYQPSSTVYSKMNPNAYPPVIWACPTSKSRWKTAPQTEPENTGVKCFGPTHGKWHEYIPTGKCNGPQISTTQRGIDGYIVREYDRTIEGTRDNISGINAPTQPDQPIIAANDTSPYATQLWVIKSGTVQSLTAHRPLSNDP